ncbi:hypothetical protein ACFWMR_35835 [Amycolatopsis thailandensis]|uniref:hypothetical protein n=1 Tax=Amycolatopsis thailandensis TaxID=589330 RepID=UPI003658411F
MAGVDGLAARIHAASTTAARAIAALRRSRGLLIEALAEYRVALAGVRDLDTAAVPGVLDEALAEVEATTARVQEALSRIEVYLRHLTGPAGAPVPVVAGAGASGAGDSSERIARLRARLPPPVKPASGQKTHGLWFARGRGEAESRHLVSGKKKGVDGDPAEATHAEVQTYLKEIGLKPLAIACSHAFFPRARP